MMNGYKGEFNAKNVVTPEWVDNITWVQIMKGMKGLRDLNGFSELCNYFNEQNHKFRAIYEAK